MKAELLEANYNYYVVINHDKSNTKSLLDFKGHKTMAKQFAEIVNKACSECGGIGGLHGQVFHQLDRADGLLAGTFDVCSQGTIETFIA